MSADPRAEGPDRSSPVTAVDAAAAGTEPAVTGDGQLHVPRHTGLLWGAATQWMAMGLSILLGLTITPLIIRTLGKEPYGLWGLVASFVGFYGMFDFGLSAAVSRFLGAAMGKRDLAEFNRVASTGKTLLTVAALFLLLAALLVLKPAQSILRIPEMYAGQFQVLVILAAVTTAASMVLSIYGGALLASEDFLFLNGLRMLWAVMRSLASLAAVLAGYGVVGLVAANMLVTLVDGAVTWLRCRARLPQMRASYFDASAPTARALLGFGAATMVVTVADMLRLKMDVTLVTRFQGLEATGFYTIALTVFGYFLRATLGPSLVMWPRLNKLQGRADLPALQGFFLQASHALSLCVAAVSGVLVGLAPLLIRLWLGPGYDLSATVVRILVCGFFLDLATNLGIGSLYATARHRYYALQNSIEAVLCFGSALLLGSMFGMLGVATGLVIPIVLVKLTVQPWYVTRNLQVRWTAYWLRTVGAPSLMMGTLAGGLALAEHQLTGGHWGASLLLGLASLLLAAVIGWHLVLDARDRSWALARIAGAMRRRVVRAA